MRAYAEMSSLENDVYLKPLRKPSIRINQFQQNHISVVVGICCNHGSNVVYQMTDIVVGSRIVVQIMSLLGKHIGS